MVGIDLDLWSIPQCYNAKQTYLIFVELTVFILLLSLLLEGDDDKAHKYIHHEECNKDKIDDKEDWYRHSVIV